MKQLQPETNKMSRKLLSVWTGLYLLVIFLGIPLAVGPQGYQTILDVKFGLFLWGTRIYLAGVPLLWLELLATGQEKPPSFQNLREKLRYVGIVRWLILAFALLCGISALLSPYPEIVWGGGANHMGFETILLLSLTFLCVSSFGVWKRWYAALFAVASLLNGAVAALQLCGRNPFLLFPEGITYTDAGSLYSGEYLGLVGNAGLFAAYFCLAVPLLLFAAVRERGWLRWLSLVGGLAGLIALFASRIAGGVVGFLGMGFLLLPLLLKLGAVRFGWRHPVRAGLLLQLALALAGFGLLWFWQGQSGTLYELSEVLHGRIQDSFGSSRIAIWKEALSLVPSSPFFGGGPDTYLQRSSILFTRMLESGVPVETRVAEAHNEYLNLLVNTGLFSLLAYLGALLAPLVCTIRKISRGEGRLLLLAAPVLCYGIQACFGIASCAVFPLFWLLWALLSKAADAKAAVFIEHK